MAMYNGLWIGATALLGVAILLSGCGTRISAPSTTQAFPTSKPQVAETPEGKATEMPECTWAQLLGGRQIKPGELDGCPVLAPSASPNPLRFSWA